MKGTQEQQPHGQTDVYFFVVHPSFYSFGEEEEDKQQEEAFSSGGLLVLP